MGAAGHLVHFCLLLDFACFLLAHIYNPEKLSGSLLRCEGHSISAWHIHIHMIFTSINL